MRGCLDAAFAGRGGLVLIGGEAGIGKTALAESLCRDAAERGTAVLVGRCFDMAETPAYGPWLDLFERAAADAALPPLPPAFATPGVIGAVGSQADLFRAVRDYLKSLAAAQPVVLLLDDMHWADAASADLLRFLAQSVAALPLLILVTYRADELTRDRPLHTLLPALVRESGAARIDLRPLDDGAVRALVIGRYRLAAADMERLVAYLHARAEGNALFLGELLRSLEEEGTLRIVDNGWLLGDLAHTAVPPLLRQVIDARVARLATEHQQLLAIAAIIGQETPYDLWATVAGTDEGALLDAVAEVESARIVAENHAGSGAVFVHALIREAVYEGIRPSRRRRWHRAAGEVLAMAVDADPHAVAYHFQQSGDKRAAAWLVRAGERAARAYAWLTAADRFEAALALMDRDDANPHERGWLLYHLATLRALSGPDSFTARLDEAERLARDVGDRGLAALSVYWRGGLRCITGERRRGLRDMEDGVAARRALTDVERASLPSIPIPHTVRDDTDGEAMLVQWLATVGRYAEARGIGERVLADAQASGTPRNRGGPFVGDIQLGLAQAYAGLGLPKESRAAFAQARRAYRAIGHEFMAGISAANELRWIFPFISDDPTTVSQLLDEMDAAMAGGGESPSQYLGRFPRMIRQLIGGEWHEGRRQFDAPGGTIGFQQTASQLLTPILRAQGDTNLAWGLVRAILPDGPTTEPGDTWLPNGLTHQRLAAALALDAGDANEARDWLEAHDRWVTWSGSPLGRADGQLSWSGYHRATGKTTSAADHATRALAHATEPRQPLALLAAHRLLGELDTDAGRYAEATAHLATALALADACAAPYERALTLLARADLHTAMGQRAEATTALDAAHAICESLGAKPALARADALAARLAPPRPATPVYPVGLTAREAEVLRLLAAGRTNREIADALFLAPGTVNIHVTRVLAKTDSANRTEASAFAHRHGLA